MSKHSPPIFALPCVIFTLLFPPLLKLSAQEAGIGSFNDLVGQVIINAPTPPPIPQPAPLTFTREGKPVVPEPSPPPPAFTIVPAVGLEYDYRFNQQRTGDRFETNINEAHALFALTVNSTLFLVEYAHIWTDASNDAHLTRSSDGNAVKAQVTQPIFTIAAKDKGPTTTLSLTLPFIFKADTLDEPNPAGRRTSDIDSYTLNPFFLAAASWPLQKEKEEPGRSLKLSLAPGYRLAVSDKDFTNVMQPSLHGWKGTFSLLPRVDWDVTQLVSIYGSVTWNHLTNFSLSNHSPPPDADSFALATGITIKPKILKETKERKDAQCRPLALLLSYQYDGFNRDFYQHSLTVRVFYTF